MLIVELDGSQHAEPSNLLADAARTQQLRALGFELIRFWNVDVKSNIAGVLDAILTSATERVSQETKNDRA